MIKWYFLIRQISILALIYNIISSKRSPQLPKIQTNMSHYRLLKTYINGFMMKKQKRQYSIKQKFLQQWVHVKMAVSVSQIIPRTTQGFRANTFVHRIIIIKFRAVSQEKLQNLYRQLHANAIRKYQMQSITKQKSARKQMRCLEWQLSLSCI